MDAGVGLENADELECIPEGYSGRGAKRRKRRIGISGRRCGNLAESSVASSFSSSSSSFFIDFISLINVLVRRMILDELLEMLIDPTSSEVGIGHPQIFFTNIMRHSKDIDQRDEVNEEENEELEEDEEATEDSAEFRLPPDMPMRLFRLFAPRPLYPSGIHSSSSAFSNPTRPSMPKEDTDTKVSTYLDLLVSASIDKRKLLMKKLQRSGGDAGTTFQVLTGSNRTIVYLRDFQSIIDSSRGQIAHQVLLNIIRNRRRLGEKIVLVVSDDLPNENVTSTSFANHYYHIIKIPPPVSHADKLVLQEDRDARTREINLRSIQSAIRQRSLSPSMEFECPVGIHLDTLGTSSIHGLDKDVWELSKVQRVVSIAMGNHGRWQVEHQPQQTVPITLADVAQAVEDMERADKERADSKQEQKAAREFVDPLEQPRDIKRENPQLTPINSKDCNKHEQRLLGGVIDPGNSYQLPKTNLQRKYKWVFAISEPQNQPLRPLRF